MISGKFIVFETKKQFEIKLAAKEISDLAIVFIKDTGELWTRGVMFCKTNGSDHNHDGSYLPINGTAADSLKLGNIVANYYVSGNNSTGTFEAMKPEELNLNRSTFFWRQYDTADVDFGEYCSGFHTQFSGGNYAAQLALLHNSNKIKVRFNKNNEWQTPFELYTEKNSNLNTINWTAKDFIGTNLTINKGSINLNFPIEATGGWARGILFSDSNNRFGGFGVFGSGETKHRISLSFGENWWDSNGMHITPDNNFGFGIFNPKEKIEINGNIKATSFIGNVTGNVSGSSGSCTGNAATVTNGVYTNTDQTISGKKTFSVQQAFSVAQGTAPFTVTSNIVVTNLNSNYLEGFGSSSFWKKSELEIGGRNYALNSTSFSAGGGAPGITGSINSDGSLSIVATSGNGNWFTSFCSLSGVEDNFIEGETFTISFEMKAIGTTNKPKIYLKSGMGYFEMLGTLSTEYSTIYYTGVWKKTNPIALHFGMSSTIGTLTVKNVKVEKGNIPTKWCPAWEDKADLSALNLKANIASPSFTGIPLAPTAAAKTNTTQIATTAFVRKEVSDLVNGAPETLDTLAEIAAYLTDGNVAGSIVQQLAGKVSKVGDTMTDSLLIKKGRSFDPNSIGMDIGNLHLVTNSTTGDYVSSITFSGQPNSASQAQAGIYVQGSGSYGTKMYFATTNSHAIGPIKSMVIDAIGNIWVRGILNAVGGLQVNGQNVWHLGNFNPSDYSQTSHAHGLGNNDFSKMFNDSEINSTTFRTTVFGDNGYNYRFKISRWSSAPNMYGGMGSYGTSLNWAGGDTHGFLAVDYNTKNVRIGGGNGDKLNWNDRVVLFGQNIGSGSTEYAAGNHTHNYAGSSSVGGVATKSYVSEQIEAFTGDDFSGGNHYLKAIRYDGWHTRLYMGYHRDGTKQNTVHVGYADSAISSNYTGFVTPKYDGGVILNPQQYFNRDIGLKVAMTGTTGSQGDHWGDTLWINGYAGTDVPNCCALHFSRHNARMFLSLQDAGGTSYGTLYEVYHKGNLDIESLANKHGHLGYDFNVRELNVHGDGIHFLKYGNDAGGWDGADIYLDNEGNKDISKLVFYVGDDQYDSFLFKIGSLKIMSIKDTGLDINGAIDSWGAFRAYSGATIEGGLECPDGITVMNKAVLFDGCFLQEPLSFYSRTPSYYYTTNIGSALNLATPNQYFSIIDSNGGGLNSYFAWGSTTSTNVPMTIRMELTNGTLTVNKLIQSSDIRLKENIVPLENSLDKLNRINPVKFNFKEDSNVLEYGFIAQELQNIYPELVQNGLNNMLSLNYTGLIPVLTKAIQELTAKVYELEYKLNNLNK